LPSGYSKHNKDLLLRLFLIAFYSHYLGFVGNVWACPIKPFNKKQINSSESHPNASLKKMALKEKNQKDWFTKKVWVFISSLVELASHQCEKVRQAIPHHWQDCSLVSLSMHTEQIQVARPMGWLQQRNHL
jgi:hypothetical protein